MSKIEKILLTILCIAAVVFGFYKSVDSFGLVFLCWTGLAYGGALGLYALYRREAE